MGRVRSALICAVLIGMATACAAQEGPPSRAELDAIVAANGREHGLPAQAVVVTHNGRTIYEGYAGTRRIDGGGAVTSDTVFGVFSVSKLFASVLLYQEVEAGRIDLDVPAARYVSSLPQAWRAITVRQFLDHVSGAPEYFDPADLSKPFPSTREAAFASLDGRPLVESSDTRTRYTQTNYLVLGAVLEAVTGKSYGDLVRERIVDKLGLKSVRLGRQGVPDDRLAADYQGENGRIAPAPPIAWPVYARSHADGYATAADLAVFLDALAAGRLVSPAKLVELWRPHAFANGNTGFFASGWDYGETGAWREVGHDGAAKLRVRLLFKGGLSERYVIVYLANGSADGVWSRKLVDSIQGRLPLD